MTENCIKNVRLEFEDNIFEKIKTLSKNEHRTIKSQLEHMIIEQMKEVNN